MSASLTRSLDDARLAAYVARQLDGTFPDGDNVAVAAVRDVLPSVLARVEHCFSHIANKYFFDGRGPVFSHLHGDQYSMFLYLLSVEFGRLSGASEWAMKAFLLNKALHGIDAYYEVELPDVFLFVHPLGTVLGRAKYGNHLLVYQRCGVGSNRDVYPTLGDYCTLRPGSSVLGRSAMGRNCTLAADSLLLDRDLADDSLYIGNPRDFVVRSEAAIPTIWRSGTNRECN